MNVPSDVIEFAGSTANSFHSRVVAAFRAAGWHTLVSPYYLDASTSRTREIDLVAEKIWSSSGRLRPATSLHMKLFVECKYIPENTLFWFDDRDPIAACEWIVRNTPLPRLPNSYTEKHHYIAADHKVAKLFAARGTRDSDREAIYKALNQVLHSMVYLRRKGTIVPANSRSDNPSRIVEFPVIVVNGFDQVFRVDMSNLSNITQVGTNFQLEVNYAYLDFSGKDQREYFLIDVVALDHLEEFFSALEADAEAMAPFMENRGQQS